MKNKKFLWALMGVMLLMVLAACCGDGSKEGGKEDSNPASASAESNPDNRTVVIGGIYDITGGTGDVGTPYAEGEKAYFEYLEAKGGIEGLNLKLVGKDYAYKIPEAQKVYQELRDKEKVAAVLGWGTGDTEALRQQVATDEFPYLSASYSRILKDVEESPYNFLVAASYSDQGRTILKWIKENHKGRNPTVALLYNDTAFGRSPIEDIKEFA